MASVHDLIIGFYSGSATGSGFTSMSLDVKINGTNHINNFTSVAAANAFFQNHAVDYGALSGTSLKLDVSLSITESTVGGYDFGMLIGDPPAADAAAHHNMVAAMASFGAGGGGSFSPFEAMHTQNQHPLLAAHTT